MTIKPLHPFNVQTINKEVKLGCLNHDVFKEFRQTKLPIYSKSYIDFINIEDILYLKAEGNYCRIVCLNSKDVLASKTLKYYAGLLFQKSFVRIHRGYFVNLLKVISITRKNDLSLKLQNGEVVPVSRKHKEEVYSKLLGRLTPIFQTN